MPRFEFKVIPAPTKGKSAKGLRSRPERFANAMELVMNEMGAEGWDYVRTDTLPAEERQGLTGRNTVWHNMLVFRRVIETDSAQENEDVKPTGAGDTSTAQPADTARAHAAILSNGVDMAPPLTSQEHGETYSPALPGETRDSAG